MYPLLIFSMATWIIGVERFLRFRRVSQMLEGFFLNAQNDLLKGDGEALRDLCETHRGLPTADLLSFALKRRSDKSKAVRTHWRRALERQRLKTNQDLKGALWVLGTIASSAPFIGLFGTVVGILRAFENLAAEGKGGFSTVATGISEALVATASGIIVAVVAVLAYNAFQTVWSRLTTRIRYQMEELIELLESDTTQGEESSGLSR